MKTIHLISIISLALAGCATRPKDGPAPAASTSGVSASLSDLGGSLSDAGDHVRASADGISEARTLAQRIDDKAAIVNRYWGASK